MMLAAVPPARLIFSSNAQPVKPQRRSRTSMLAVNAVDIKGAGASGYAVEGFRPTSPKAWEIMSTTLRNAKLKMVSPQELVFAQQRGATVVDIRPSDEHAASRIPGSISIEFFRLIEGWDPVKVSRRAVYAFFGVLNGTEFNDRFFDEFAAAVPDTKAPVVLLCNIGGTLEPTGPSEFGRQSRSLAAAYELRRAGYTNVQVLNGGFYEWKKAGRETEE